MSEGTEEQLIALRAEIEEQLIALRAEIEEQLIALRAEVIAGTEEARQVTKALRALLVEGQLIALRAEMAQRERERQQAEMRRLGVARRVGALVSLTPTEFEQCVATVLRAQGWQNVRVVGGSGDVAADILALDPHGRSVAVQCKRYAPGIAVGSPVIQTVLAMALLHHGADRAMVVTTSSFTEPATKLAEAHGVELVDGARLTQLAGGDALTK